MNQHVTVLTVSDLHCSKPLYEQLLVAVSHHKPDIVVLAGDSIHWSGDSSAYLNVGDCAEGIGRLPCRKIAFIEGNHDLEVWSAFLAAWQKQPNPERLQILAPGILQHGQLMVVGLPCDISGADKSITGWHYGDANLSEWINKSVEYYGVPFKTLWFIHEPPSGTPLTPQQGFYRGSDTTLKLLQKYQPRFVVSGHEHAHPRHIGMWYTNIGTSTLIDTGQDPDGILQYCVFRFQYDSYSPSEHGSVEVNAFPCGQTIKQKL